MINWIVLFLFLSLNAFAVFRVGNGGDVLVCDHAIYRDSGFLGSYSRLKSKTDTDHILLLDLYLGYKRWNRSYTILEEIISKELRNNNLSDNADVSVDFVINYFSNHLEDFSPRRSQLLNVIYRRFKADLKSQRKEELRYGGPVRHSIIQRNFDTKGHSDYFLMPKGCEVQRVVQQFTRKDFYADKQFYFNTYLWDQMDALNKAVTILHETFIYENYHYNPRETLGVRYFTSAIASNHLKLVNTFKAFYYVLRAAKFYRTDIDGTTLPLAICEDKNYYFTSGHKVDSTSVFDACPDHLLKFVDIISYPVVDKDHRFDYRLEFNEDGSIKHLQLPIYLYNEIQHHWWDLDQLPGNDSFFNNELSIVGVENINDFRFVYKNNKLQEIRPYSANENFKPLFFFMDKESTVKETSILVR